MFCLCLAHRLREDDAWMPAEGCACKDGAGIQKNSPNAQVIEYLTDIIKKAIFSLYRLNI